MLKTTTTANGSSRKESKMESLNKPPFSAISEHSSVKGSPTDIRAWLTSLRRDSPANPSPSPETKTGRRTSGTSGLKLSNAFAVYDRGSRYWKMSQLSLLTRTLEPFWGTWPRVGTVCGGIAYPRRPLAPRLYGTASGLWPAPTASDAMRLRMLPEIHLRSRSSHTARGVSLGSYLSLTLAAAYGASQTPTLSEYLMGWPIGHTDLKPLGTDRFRRWLDVFGRR